MAALGLVAGSFLTVVIERVPRGASVVWPRSSCPHCGRPIAARDLVPVLGWILLRGRCRRCAAPIPATYPLVEAVTALAWVAVYARFGPTWAFAQGAVLLTLLVAVTVIDLRHHLIPNRLLLAGAAVAGPLTLGAGLVPWADALLGAMTCGGLLLAVAVLSRGGMGGGDVKLGALLGLVLGWRLGLLALAVGFVAGALVASALLLSGRKRRRDAIAFGPFLAAGAAVALFSGHAVLHRYLGTFPG